MKSKYGFSQMNLAEFETYLQQLRVGRTVLYVQQHHTYAPGYSHCTDINQLELQRNMKHHHVHNNGWSDIGQHFSTFPDGSIITGRSMEKSPACIYGNNANSICLEHVGYFDTGKDTMSDKHKQTIVKMTALLCNKFNIPINTDKIVYHHWFHLSSGIRNDGAGGNKSCPGTAFFGGNKVQDCQQHFLPLVRNASGPLTEPATVDVHEYRMITASRLNVRMDASSSAEKAPDRDSIPFGSVLRVFGLKDGWYKISSSQSHWVYGKYTNPVTRATVNATILNVRSGPSISHPQVGKVTKGEEIFITEEQNGWCKIGTRMEWVSADYIDKVS